MIENDKDVKYLLNEKIKAIERGNSMDLVVKP
jgi:hypothetical protein